MHTNKILVVNDAPEQLELLVFIIREAGYQVFSASGAAEGLKIAKSEPPDLIICDVAMPDMDGIEMCRRIRADENLRPIPFLLVSALRKDTESVVKALEAGADDYIEAPYETMRLIARVTQLIERRQADKALRESESQLRTIFDNAAIGVGLVRPDGSPLKSNPALEKMLGYTDRELSQMSFSEFTYPDDVAGSADMWREIFEGKRETHQLEKRYLKKSGEVMWGRITGSGISADDGKPKFAIAMVEDVTDRKLAENALRASEERFKLQYKSIPIPTCTWKKTGDDFELFDFNDAAVEITKGGIHRFVGKKASEFYAGEPQIFECFNRCFNEQSIVKKETVLRFKSTGELKNLDISWVFVAPDIVMMHYRDITEQTHAQESLSQSEDRFQLASRATNDALWDWNITDNTSWLSDNYLNLIGCSQNDVENNYNIWLQAVHPEDRERILDRLNAAIEKGENYWSDEYRLRIASGKYAYIFDRGYIVYDEEGKPQRMIGAAIDISKRKKTENALRQSNEHLALAQEAAKIGSFEINLQTNTGVASKQLAAIYGVPATYSPNYDAWLKLVHPDDLERVKEGMKEVLESGEINSEYRILRPDGGTRWVYGRGKVFYDDKGAPLKMVGINIDITDRKEAEATLRFQKSLLEAQSEASIDGILVVAPGGEIISYNRRFVEMWGIPTDVLATKSDEKFLQAVIDKLVRPDEFLETVSYLYEHTSVKDQVEILLNDGRIFERYTSPVIVADKTYLGRVWSFRDITKRKQIDDAIRFQAHLLNTVEQSVIATDLSGVVNYWNRFAEKLYGWTAAEAVGRSIIELTTPGVNQKKASKIMQRLAEGKSWTGEFTVRNKNGETFPAHICNSPVNDAQGNLIGIVGVSIDISERKKAERALTEANERAIREYDRLLQRLSTLAQTSGAARDLNTVFRAILNFSRASVPCSSLIISLYDKEKNERRIIYVWDNGKESPVENFKPTAVSSGSVGEAVIVNDYLNGSNNLKTRVTSSFEENSCEPLSAIIAPMTIMGNALGVIEVQSSESAAFTEEHATAMRMAANLAANAVENVRLLEQERHSAEQLRQSQKLESVGRLAGGIAHDFNNMLTAINGYSDLALRRLSEEDPLRRYIEEIKKAGERSAMLTHQLLAFSRRQVLKPKVLNLNEILEDTGRMLQRLIGEDIQLRFIPDPDLGRIEADPGQLTQVILNLAVNSRDAMPQGGSITIETANVYLDDEYARNHVPTRTGSYVLLSVSDTGTGMNLETREHIFEPFYTTKETGKGTGLGLPTVYGVVKQSGGYIWVESEEGKGTRFEIYLPRIDEKSESFEASLTTETAPHGTETILLVEDEVMVRNLSRQMLETCGYRVVEASDGIEALSIFKTQRQEIDLLMTDVVMPQMSGRELAEKITCLRPDIRLLFTSGYTDDAVIRQGIVTEDMNFIQKPFTFEELSKKIRELLDAKNNE